MSLTFYKYRAFDSLSVRMLLEDKVYFASAEQLNDPLDCRPSVRCDFDKSIRLLGILRDLFIRYQVAVGLKDLRSLGLSEAHAEKYAVRRAHDAFSNEFAYLDKSQIDPDWRSTDNDEEAEKREFSTALEKLLHRAVSLGVFSLSATCTNPLMWSHYGDEHRGFCVGYSLGRDTTPELHKVCYGGERYIRASLIEKAFGGKGDHIAAEDVEHLVLLRKAKAWSYEEEYRCLADPGEKDSPLKLTEVVFGLQCSDSTIYLIRTALESRKQVQYSRIAADKNTFQLRKREMTKTEFNNLRLPRTALTPKELLTSI